MTQLMLHNQRIKIMAFEKQVTEEMKKGLEKTETNTFKEK